MTNTTQNRLRTWSLTCRFTGEEDRKLQGTGVKVVVEQWAKEHNLPIDQFWNDSTEGEPAYYQGFLRVSEWQTEGFDLEEVEEPRFADARRSIHEARLKESAAAGEVEEFSGKLESVRQTLEILRADRWRDVATLEAAEHLYAMRLREAQQAEQMWAEVADEVECWRAGLE